MNEVFILKIWIKTLVALIIGVLLGLFLKPNFFSIELLKFISDLVVNLLLFLTPLFIIVKSYMGYIKLKKDGIYLKTISIFLGLSAVTSLVTIIITVCLMNFKVFHIPGHTVITQISDIPLYNNNLFSLIKRIVNPNLFRLVVENGDYILPYIFIGLIFGAGSFFAGKKGVYFIETVESFDAILSKIVRQIIEIFPLGAVFLITYTIKTDFIDVKNLVLILKTLSTTIVISIVIISLYSLYLFLILKKNVGKFFIGFLGASLTAFITGMPLAVVIPLNKHIKDNLGVDQDISDALTPISLIINRSGTMIVSSVVILTILSIYSLSFPPFSLQVLIILFLFFTSFLLDGSGVNGFIVLVSMVMSIKMLHLEPKSYLILISSIPILSRIGLLIDSLSSAVLIYTTAKFQGKVNDVKYIDFI